MSNPIAVVRDISSSPQNGRYVHEFVGRITGGGTHVVTVETGLKSILSAVIVNETDANSILVPTIGDSSTYAGTKTVAFTVANNKTYSYRITGNMVNTETVPTTSGATTITYYPAKQQ